MAHLGGGGGGGGGGGVNDSYNYEMDWRQIRNN